MRKHVLLLASAALLAGATVALPASDAAAQATCRNKCNDEEQACLARTGNKGQCGERAKQCAEKCK